MESERDITTRISERQMRLWNALHPRGYIKTSPPRFVTISRDEGTLGDEIAQMLSERLSWRLYDREIVNVIANNSHVREELVRRLDEKSQDLFNETLLDRIFHLLRLPDQYHFGPEEYYESLLKTLATLAAHGNALLVGRGANFALRNSEYGFHIRTVGSLEVRVDRFCKSRQMLPEIARRHILAVDADIDDPFYYNIIFNTDHLTVQQVVASVTSMLNPADTEVRPRLAAN